jgi:hypothetical protein
MSPADIGIRVHSQIRHTLAATNKGVGALEYPIGDGRRADVYKFINPNLELGEIKPNRWFKDPSKQKSIEGQLGSKIMATKLRRRHLNVNRLHSIGPPPPMPLFLDPKQILITSGPFKGVFYYKCNKAVPIPVPVPERLRHPKEQRRRVTEKDKTSKCPAHGCHKIPSLAFAEQFKKSKPFERDLLVNQKEKGMSAEDMKVLQNWIRSQEKKKDNVPQT